MPLPTTPPSGGLGVMSGAIMAVSLLMTMRRQPPGPVGMLIEAGAIDADTALKPRTAGIARPDELKRPLRLGVVVMLEDGRCWVDRVRLRKRRMWMALVMGVGVMIAIDLVWMFLRWVRVL